MRRVVAFLGTLLMASTGVAFFAAPASALASCPEGVLRTLGSTSAFVCLDPSDGKVLSESPGARSIVTSKGLQLTQKSSTLADTAGADASVDSAIGAVELNGAADAATVSELGPPGLLAGVIIVGTYTGYQIGSAGTDFACKLGVGSLCTPHSGSNFAPNQGIAISGTSAWHPDSVTTAAGTHISQFGYSADNPWVAPPAYGDTTTGSGRFALYAYVDPIPGGYVNDFRAQLLCADGSVFRQAGAVFQFDNSGNPNQSINSDPGYLVGGGNGESICTNAGGFGGAQIVDSDGTVLARGYASGDPNAPSSGSANPTRHWRTDNDCTDGSVNSATSDAFTEMDSSFPPFPKAAKCAHLAGVKVYELTAGAADKLVYSVDIPASVQKATDPDDVCNQFDHNCRLDLIKIGPTGSDLGDCFTNAGLCSKWFSDPSKVDDYQCTYGLPGNADNVALSECNAYAPTFDVQQVAKGHVYGDPRTGATGDTGTSTSTDGDGDQDDDPGAGSAAASGSCYPHGWSAFNPLEWVLKPIECAFIPDSGSIEGNVATISDAYNDTTLGDWGGAIGGVGQVAIPDGGCGGLTLHVPALPFLQDGDGESATAFNSCNAPWSTIAVIVKAFLYVIISWATLLAVYKNLAASFGLNVNVRSE